MCGIFGVLQHRATARPPEAPLRETLRRLRHRGPDGCGLHADVGVALAHTRLSLVDLDERSNQPMWDSTGRYCLVYNGELYGYQDLRAELAGRGVRFRTTSDTEVLLEALVHLGVEKALDRVDGMFAFGLWDARDRSLVVARDRFGIKPLFIHVDPTSFLFASSVDAMRPWIELRPDPLTVSAFLHGFNGPTAGRSFYEGVRIVPPGGLVRVDLGGRARFSQCLTLNELVDPEAAAELARRPRAQLVDEVEALLLESVESQLAADAPVGAFCSGGVDSSLIVAMAARMHGDLRIFHADIEGPLSERSAAEDLASHLGLELGVVPVTDRDFVEGIPDAVEHFCAPFVNATLIPVHRVSRLVSEHQVKAVLTGEASDECYLGYPWLAPNIPDAARRALRRLVPGFLGTSNGEASNGGIDPGLVEGLVNGFEADPGPEGFRAGETSSRYHATSAPGLTSNGELSYILRTLLYRNDTMGMASGIECRFPFLDRRLVTMSAHLPVDCKIRFSPIGWDPEHPFYRDKWIIRQIAARYLPTRLSHRKKGMFPTNAFQRMRIAEGFFEDSFTAELYGVSRARMGDVLAQATGHLRLRLMLLESWGHRCIRECPREALDARLAAHVEVAPIRAA